MSEHEPPSQRNQDIARASYVARLAVDNPKWIPNPVFIRAFRDGYLRHGQEESIENMSGEEVLQLWQIQRATIVHWGQVFNVDIDVILREGEGVPATDAWDQLCCESEKRTLPSIVDSAPPESNSMETDSSS